MVSSRRLDLADELARIDVDGHQRFGLVDDDMAAGLQPDFGPQRLFDLLGDAELVEDGGGPGVELDATDQRGLEALHEAQDVFVNLFVIHPNALEGGGELVAQDALDHVEIVVYQGGSGALFGLLAEVEPEVVEELHVGAQLFFAAAFAGGADDKAAGNAGAIGLQDALEAQALLVGRDFAGDADVVDGGHVDQEAAGQGDVGGNARAFLAERLLGDLHDDFLAFAEEVGDGDRGGTGGLGAARRVADGILANGIWADIGPGLLRARLAGTVASAAGSWGHPGGRGGACGGRRGGGSGGPVRAGRR